MSYDHCALPTISFSWVSKSNSRRQKHTLNSYMNVILRLFSLTGVFVGFGEGVCDDGGG
jgi:hypothetical protein